MIRYLLRVILRKKRYLKNGCFRKLITSQELHTGTDMTASNWTKTIANPSTTPEFQLWWRWVSALAWNRRSWARTWINEQKLKLDAVEIQNRLKLLWIRLAKLQVMFQAWIICCQLLRKSTFILFYFTATTKKTRLPFKVSILFLQMCHNFAILNTQTDTHRQAHTDRRTQTDTRTETHAQRHTHRGTHTEAHTQTHTHARTHTHSPTFPSLQLHHNSFSNPSITLPRSQALH